MVNELRHLSSELEGDLHTGKAIRTIYATDAAA